MAHQQLAHGNIKGSQGHGDAGHKDQVEHVGTDDVADAQVGMALLQRGDGGDQLRQAGAQGNEGQSDDGLGDAQTLGDDGAVLHQQIGTPGDEGGANHQQNQIHPQGVGLGIAVFLLFLHTVGVFHALTDGEDQVNDEDGQHHKAQRTGEGAHDVGGEAVDGGADEEKDHRHLHGFGVHGTGVEGHGDGGNEGGVADDGANGVAVGHRALTQERTGGGDHDLGQGGADGYHGGTNYDVGQIETPGNAGGAVNEPVAALDEQDKAQGEEQNRNKHDISSLVFRLRILYHAEGAKSRFGRAILGETFCKGVKHGGKTVRGGDCAAKDIWKASGL